MVEFQASTKEIIWWVGGPQVHPVIDRLRSAPGNGTDIACWNVPSTPFGGCESLAGHIGTWWGGRRARPPCKQIHPLGRGRVCGSRARAWPCKPLEAEAASSPSWAWTEIGAPCLHWLRSGKRLVEDLGGSQEPASPGALPEYPSIALSPGSRHRVSWERQDFPKFTLHSPGVGGVVGVGAEVAGWASCPPEYDTH